MENPFVKLFAVNLKDHLEVKKSGSTELKYVSWPYAWAEVKKLYPSASYEVKKFNGLPYVYDPITGFMVYTSVTIEGVSHEMWLPVMDNSNKAMKAIPYTYTAPKWDYNPQTHRREKIGMEERTVEAASMVNHWGTIILAEPLELPDDGRRYIDEETDWNYDSFDGAEKKQRPSTTVAEFMSVYMSH